MTNVQLGEKVSPIVLGMTMAKVVNKEETGGAFSGEEGGI
jgi:hypothetical protein